MRVGFWGGLLAGAAFSAAALAASAQPGSVAGKPPPAGGPPPDIAAQRADPLGGHLLTGGGILFNPGLNAFIAPDPAFHGTLVWQPLPPRSPGPSRTVATTLRLSDGTTVDCVKSEVSAPQLDAPPTPEEAGDRGAAPSAPTPQVAGPAVPECPEGTFPNRSLPTAAPGQGAPMLDFNSKDHGLSHHGQSTGGPPAPLADVPHRYAHANAFVANHGMRARLNVWHPKVPDDENMTLAQTWITAYRKDNGRVQTVESGWQVWHGWGTEMAVPFIYFTANGYRGTPDVAGCYNWDVESCNQFQLVYRKPFLGVALPVQSQADGHQGTLDIQWIQKPNGNWWVRMNGIWLGYYPASVFDGGPLGSAAQGIDVGGEATGDLPMSEMGSGRYAEEGFRKAAFASNLGYYDGGRGFVELSQDRNPLKPSMSDSACYTVDFQAQPPVDGTPGLSFFFGGPGTNHFGTDPNVPRPVGTPEACEGPGG